MRVKAPDRDAMKPLSCLIGTEGAESPSFGLCRASATRPTHHSRRATAIRPAAAASHGSSASSGIPSWSAISGRCELTTFSPRSGRSRTLLCQRSSPFLAKVECRGSGQDVNPALCSTHACVHRYVSASRALAARARGHRTVARGRARCRGVPRLLEASRFERQHLERLRSGSTSQACARLRARRCAASGRGRWFPWTATAPRRSNPARASGTRSFGNEGSRSRRQPARSGTSTSLPKCSSGSTSMIHPPGPWPKSNAAAEFREKHAGSTGMRQSRPRRGV